VLLIQKNSLTIVVTHRLETIHKADHLIVMDHGVVVDQGAPAELSLRCALYREFLQHLEE
jgi:ABC-type multidrug transport system fused ATPase/permease subunit